MSETKHTPGPWMARHQTGKKDGFIQKTGWIHIEVVNEEADHRFNRGIAQLHNISEPNLKRIVDCVNACEGINTESVPDMLEALESVREEARPDGSSLNYLLFEQVKDAIAKATGQEESK